MVSFNTIIGWFKRGMYPTEVQFEEVWGSFWHKQEPIPPGNILGLTQILQYKADTQIINNTLNDRIGFGDEIEVTEAGFDVVFVVPFPEGVEWRWLSKPYCFNDDGEDIGFTITNKTRLGFRIIPSEASTFNYQIVKK